MELKRLPVRFAVGAIATSLNALAAYLSVVCVASGAWGIGNHRWIPGIAAILIGLAIFGVCSLWVGRRLEGARR